MANNGGSSDAVDFEAQLPDIYDSPEIPYVVATTTDEGSHGRNHLCIGCLQASPISVLLSCVVCVFRPLWCLVKVMFLSLLGILALTLIIIIRPDKIWDIQLFRLLEPSIKKEEREKCASIKRKQKAIRYKLHELSFVTTVRMGWVILLWMVINLSVPSLRRVSFLGSLLWKWSFLVALILVTYPLLIVPFYSEILIVAIGMSFSIDKIDKSNMAYYIMGLGRSVTLLVYFTSILIAWLLFINTKSPNLHHHGALMLVSLLVGAVLSVVKSMVILLWKSRLIYNKYKGKILSAGLQLYFHLEIMDQEVPSSDILICWWSAPDIRRKTKGWIEDHSEQRPSRRKIPPIEEFLLEQSASLRHMDLIAIYLTENFELSLTESDEFPDIVPYLQEKFASIMQEPTQVRGLYGKSRLGKLHVDLLLELLRRETKSKAVPTYEDFEKWMVKGLKNCYTVGYKINGAMEVTKILDRVLTGLIVVVVFLFWLFITKFASTKVVVGLGSIFVGLAFMFGDTCKTFFQGVIFSFVTHPFDVSDRCIIDDKELRVKKINIMTTTFFGCKSKETFLYPNSDLATKHIVILHGEPEPRPLELEDLVELNFPCYTKARQIESLQKKIEGYIEDGIKSGQFKEPYRVSLKEIGSNIKMGVHFQHNLSDGGESDQLSNGVESENLEAAEIRKDKQRSKLLLQLRKFQEDVIGNEVSAP